MRSVRFPPRRSAMCPGLPHRRAGAGGRRRGGASQPTPAPLCGALVIGRSGYVFPHYTRAGVNMDSFQLLSGSLGLYIIGGLLSLLLVRREHLAIWAAGLTAMAGGILGL